mgnify:FL=1
MRQISGLVVLANGIHKLKSPGIVAFFFRLISYGNCLLKTSCFHLAIPFLLFFVETFGDLVQQTGPARYEAQ